MTKEPSGENKPEVINDIKNFEEHTEQSKKESPELNKDMPEKSGSREETSTDEKIELIRQQIKDKGTVFQSRNVMPEEKVQIYINEHLPEYIKRGPSLMYNITKFVGSMMVNEVRGGENIPEGPKLFIANHRGGETPKLIGALDRPIHIASAEIINWRSRISTWFMKKLGMVQIRESFSNIPESKRKQVVVNAPIHERKAHQRVVDETAHPVMGSNVENIRRMVAILLSGEDVAIFAEGAFSRLEKDERRAYAGFALVAREYKRITGKDLPIVPAGIRNKIVSFGEKFYVDQGKKESRQELEDRATQKIHQLFDSLNK